MFRMCNIDLVKFLAVLNSLQSGVRGPINPLQHVRTCFTVRDSVGTNPENRLLNMPAAAPLQ